MEVEHDFPDERVNGGIGDCVGQCDHRSRDLPQVFVQKPQPSPLLRPEMRPMLSLAQAGVTWVSIAYVKQHFIGEAAVIYLAVWSPAGIALPLAGLTAKSFHAGDDRFSTTDKVLVGVRLSTNLTVVAFILAGIVVYAASMVIALVIFILGGLVLWPVFAVPTDPANTQGLFEDSQSPAPPETKKGSA